MAFVNVNDTPTLSAFSALVGAVEDTAFTITYAALLAASNAIDADIDVISFRIESVTSGTLTKGGVAVVAGTTMLAVGESLVWTPSAQSNGLLNAFMVKARDGTTFSATAVQVTASVTAVNDAPTASGSNPTLTAISEDAGNGLQTSSLTLSGVYEAGDSITATINGTTATYTVVAGDIGSNQDTTRANVAAKLAAAINANATVAALVDATVSTVSTVTATQGGATATAGMLFNLDAGDGSSWGAVEPSGTMPAATTATGRC